MLEYYAMKKYLFFQELALLSNFRRYQWRRKLGVFE